MSNGLMTPFAYASISISTEDREAERGNSDTSRGLAV